MVKYKYLVWHLDLSIQHDQVLTIKKPTSFVFTFAALTLVLPAPSVASEIMSEAQFPHGSAFDEREAGSPVARLDSSSVGDERHHVGTDWHVKKKGESCLVSS
jgi:hypothetical protein